MQVFITGAGRNLGAFLAQHFLDAGHSVIAHYRTLTPDIERLQAQGVATIQGDFSSTAAIDQVAQAVLQQAKDLRLIIHNASAFAPTADDALQAAEQLHTFFNVHMLAPFLLNERLAPVLASQAEHMADIVHITDIYADNPATIYDAYAMTKAGLQNLTLSAAKKWAPQVKVNAIQPGPVDFKNWHSDAHQTQVVNSTLLQKTGGSTAVLAAIEGILNNPFQTGSIVPIDGGRRLSTW